ncbi:hypothetical protein MNEG_9351 [Monoraphidium neglectum]|uniref:SGNH hydrolase-type esterase domain-containing protein n=1 Tax=Monoraphidium neglectum TaxID=145388 RepID=A0A0D2M558_9CHLO|nr:hypothetical protein MNEG_9351 [Monoraphidium neglectum]KIY98609.1 hypothetical protein MNEG_9351 [Monoraphidium neglectum]|eukprot:XP_013897629.1 hypothetical protein MNEG_9351 [Monoraphidium neglectum]
MVAISSGFGSGDPVATRTSRAATHPDRPARRLALLLLVTTAAIALFPTTASAFSSRGPLSSDQRAAVERISALKLALSERLAAQGYKFEPSPRQWARLTQKLLTPGSVVKVVAFGGSVTVGYRYSKTSYPEQFVEWLRTSFPGVDFELTNMARRATAATFAALCLVQDMPEDADLVVVEYSINGYGGQCQCFTAPQNAGYETLIRRILKRSPQAAMMTFAAFMWLDKKGEREVYYNTGEDQHAVIARRYGIPMMSVRDSLYDVMFDPGNHYRINRSEILVDIVHVSDHGAKLYASYLAWGLRRQALRMIKHHGSRLEAAAAAPPAPMVAPLNRDAAMEDWPTFCAEGEGLQKVVAPSGEGAWQWVDEGSSACPGCHKYGFASKEVGAYLDIDVNSDVLSTQDKEADATVMLALSFLKSYSDMGKVRVSCKSGCTCKEVVMDAKNKTPTSELHTERMPISPHPQ